MDDGNSWIGIVLFAASVILFAVMYGFGAAVQALNTSALEDERDEGNKRAEKLLKIQEDPYLFIRTNQLATSILTLAMGASSLAFVVKKLTALIGTHTQICRIWLQLEFHMSRDLWESHFCSRDWGS